MVLAGFFNLVAVAVLAPLCAVLVRRRRPDMPRIVARDYAGTALRGRWSRWSWSAVGLLHRPALLEAKRARAAQLAAVAALRRPRRAASRVPRARRAGRHRAHGRRPVPHLRARRPSPTRALCLFVDTSQSPPGVTLDRAARRTRLSRAPTPALAR